MLANKVEYSWSMPTLLIPTLLALEPTRLSRFGPYPCFWCP
jgi:hypothetical protein